MVEQLMTALAQRMCNHGAVHFEAITTAGIDDDDTGDVVTMARCIDCDRTWTGQVSFPVVHPAHDYLIERASDALLHLDDNPTEARRLLVDGLDNDREQQG